MISRIIVAFGLLILLGSCNHENNLIELNNNSVNIVKAKIAELKPISTIDSLDYVAKKTEFLLFGTFANHCLTVTLVCEKN